MTTDYVGRVGETLITGGEKRNGGKYLPRQLFHQNDVESDPESNRGVSIENQVTIHLGPGKDPPAALLRTYLPHGAESFLRS